jgi:hypothetical protein
MRSTRHAPGEVNYFRGSDPGTWHTRLPLYRQVAYRQLWPGIDLRLHEEGGVLKYEFHVRPDAPLANMRLKYEGASDLTLDRSGAMLIHTSLGVCATNRQLLTRRPPASASLWRVTMSSKAGDHERSFRLAIGAGCRPCRPTHRQLSAAMRRARRWS